MIELPQLPYAYDALAPVLSEATMRTHHLKHHARYVEVANALAADAGYVGRPIEEIIQLAADAGASKLFNNVAQAWNHAFFWRCMSAQPVAPTAALEAKIVETFGSFANLRSQFLDAGVGHFGSGWAWVVLEQDRLKVTTTHDAGTHAVGSATPLLVCDLWEHAYYLDHRNDRAAFLAAWWDRLADWTHASRLISHAA